MANYAINSTVLEGIADAIRSRKDSNSLIPAAEMAEEIMSIDSETGGSGEISPPTGFGSIDITHIYSYMLGRIVSGNCRYGRFKMAQFSTEYALLFDTGVPSLHGFILSDTIYPDSEFCSSDRNNAAMVIITVNEDSTFNYFSGGTISIVANLPGDGQRVGSTSATGYCVPPDYVNEKTGVAGVTSPINGNFRIENGRVYYKGNDDTESQVIRPGADVDWLAW